MLADVEIVIVNILKFVLSISYSKDVPSDLGVDLFIDALIVDVLTGIGSEVCADASVSPPPPPPAADASVEAFAVVTTDLRFPVSILWEGSSR